MRFLSIRIFPIYLLTALVGVWNAPAAATIDPDSAVELAKKQNPELAAARMLIAEAAARMRSSGRLTNPELESEVAGGPDFEGRISAGVTQRFPLTSRLRQERMLSELDLRKAILEVEEKSRQLSTAVRIAVIDLAHRQSEVVLMQARIANAAEIANSFVAQAREGGRSALDADNAKLETEMLRAELPLLETRVTQARSDLATLLGIPADQPITVREPLDLPASPPIRRSVGDRPDVALAELAMASGEAEVALAKSSRWDDVGIGVFVEGERFRDEPDGIQPEVLTGIRFSVPLPLWQNGAGRLAEKSAALATASARRDALALAAKNQIEAAYDAMAARHRAAVHAKNVLIPLAQKSLTATNAAHTRGEVGIDTVFAARARLADVESTALSTRTAYLTAHAEWLGALGNSKP